MRKRVKNVLDFVGRIQKEEVNRSKRAETLGIDSKPLHSKRKRKAKSKSKGEMDLHKEVSEASVNGDINPRANGNGLPVLEGSQMNGETEEVDADEDEDDEEQDVTGPVERLSTRSGLTSSQLLENLTRDLINFQETWIMGGFVTPVPTASATLPSHVGEHPLSSLARQVALAMEDEDDGEEQGDEPMPQESPSNVEEAVRTQVTLDTESIIVDGSEPISAGKPTLEVAEEPMDVYREGAVDAIVTAPEEVGVPGTFQGGAIEVDS